MHTLDQVWVEYSKRRVLGKKTERQLIQQYENFIAPEFGNRDITKIKFLDVEAFHNRYRDKPYMGNRLLFLIRALYKFADALEWLHMPMYNPTRAVKMFPERKRRRYVTPQEAPILAAAIANHETASPTPMLYLWLLIFTGARSSEIGNAKWKHLKGNVLTLVQHKAEHSTGKDRIVILPPYALDKIEQLAAPVSERKPDDYIITNRTYRRYWYFMLETTQLKNLRIHDLRHTFGTYALSKGYTLDQIGEALSHTNPMTTKIYAELTNEARQVMATDVSIALFRDMKVIPIEELENDPLR